MWEWLPVEEERNGNENEDKGIFWKLELL